MASTTTYTAVTTGPTDLWVADAPGSWACPTSAPGAVYPNVADQCLFSSDETARAACSASPYCTGILAPPPDLAASFPSEWRVITSKPPVATPGYDGSTFYKKTTTYNGPLDTGAAKQFAANVTTGATVPTASSPPNDSACTLTQDIVQTCVMDNISIRDCKNVTLTCENSSGKVAQGVNCSISQAVNNAIAIITQMNLTPAQEADIEAVIARTNSVDMTQAFTDILTQYFTQRCSIAQGSTQSVFFDKIILSGPPCNNINILGVNQMNQTAKCVMSMVQQLLQLAGLGPPPPPSPPPYSDVTVPWPAVAGIIAGAVLALIFASLVGLYIRARRKAS
jgi:hypothetical protein